MKNKFQTICDECNGVGLVPVAPGIRDLRICTACNGTGAIDDNAIADIEMSMGDKRSDHMKQADIDQARETIKVLQLMLSTNQWVPIRKELEFAIREVSKCIPAKPIRRIWNPNLCPCCGADLGGECDDGYYQNPYYEICPECRQSLDYE